jgi:chromate reductase, NAD(P)H dehydrogenase (quinone)
MASGIKIFGICGSVRTGSFNMKLLQKAGELLPEGCSLDIFDRLEEIPAFNQDKEGNPPDAVVDLKRRIRAADAVLFATPEYNYSVPGVLKNAIDWASRPYGDSAWQGKTAAIIGASVGRLGTIRAQNHLRHMFVFLNMHAVNQPEVLVNYSESFDEHGALTNDTPVRLITDLLNNLVDLTNRLKG